MRLAWLALAAAPDGVARRGAVTYVARTLGMDKPAACRALAQATRSGLLVDLPRGGVSVARPLGYPAQEFLALAIAEKNHEEDADMPKQQVMIRGRLVDIEAATVIEADESTPVGLVPATTARAVVRTIPGLRRRGEWQGRAGRIHKAEPLVDLYTAARRAHVTSEPRWAPGPAAIAQISKAAERLEAQSIHPDGWPFYIDWLFANYSRWSTSLAWPTFGMLASEKVIQMWLDTLGPRSLDVNDMARRLAAQGLGEPHPAIVLDIATNFANRRDKVPTSLKPETREAVLWVIDHWAEIRMSPMNYEPGEDA